MNFIVCAKDSEKQVYAAVKDIPMVIAIGHAVQTKTGRRGIFFFFLSSLLLLLFCVHLFKWNRVSSYLKMICHFEIYELASIFGEEKN